MPYIGMAAKGLDRLCRNHANLWHGAAAWHAVQKLSPSAGPAESSVVMAYIVLAYTGMAYTDVACEVVANIGMAHKVMLHKVMAYIAVACKSMAYIDMACTLLVSGMALQPGSAGIESISTTSRVVSCTIAFRVACGHIGMAYGVMAYTVMA